MFCLTNICYVCLEKNDKSLVDINSTLSVNQDILHIIGYLPFNLAWLKTKRIILICEDCRVRLRETYYFLAKCLKNSALLLGYMDKLNTPSVPNGDTEAVLSVCLNNKQDDMTTRSGVKCEVKVEDEEIYSFESGLIMQQVEDVCGSSVVVDDVCQQEEQNQVSDRSVGVQGKKRSKSDNSGSDAMPIKKPKNNESVNSDGKPSVDTAKEVAVVPPLEVRVKPFKEMLTEQAWQRYEKERAANEQREQQLKQSPAVTGKQQKQRENRRKKREKTRKPNDLFRELLSTAHLHGKSTFSDFAHKYSRDERFKNVPKKGAREGMFREHLHGLRKREEEKKSKRREQVPGRPDKSPRHTATTQTAPGGPRGSCTATARAEPARLVTFPCRYKKHGCKEQATSASALQRHEEACSYRQYACPILATGQCPWSGIWQDLLGHCKLHHPAAVLEHPVQLTHTVTAASRVNYITQALDKLFLVQVKVCLTTGKIYHAVRLLDSASSAGQYAYEMIIENTGTEIRKIGDVLPLGCLVVQEVTALAVGISSLQEVLGSFLQTTFTITVRAKAGTVAGNSLMPARNAETCSGAVLNVKCAKCKCMRVPAYRPGVGWQCRTCDTTLTCCPNSYGLREPDGKRHKHEMFFCTGNTWCLICRTGHCALTHPAYVSTNQFLLYVCCVSWEYAILHMENASRRVICSYWLNDADFTMYIYLDAASKHLHRFTCTVELEHPLGGPSIKHTTLAVNYDQMWDWHLRIPRVEFNSYVYLNQFKMKVSLAMDDQRRTRITP